MSRAEPILGRTPSGPRAAHAAPSHGSAAAQRRAQYYRDAAAWSWERDGSGRGSQRAAFAFAAAAVLCALMLGLALWGLQPIKTRAAYLVVVDRSQGAMQAPTLLSEGRLQDRPVLIEAYLAQYVVARESIDPERLQSQYRKVMLWSDAAVSGRYRSDLSRRIASPPSADLPLGGERSDAATQARVLVTIKSVSLLSSGTALVRFQTTRQDRGGGGLAEDWTASLAFSFTRAPLTLEDRLVNPLGFQVTAYKTLKDGDLDPPSTPGRF